MLPELVLIAGGYLCGSVASAIIVCRIMGLPDPRHGGSGNPGATNVLRLGGKKAAIATLAGDVLKGVLPVLVARGLTDVPPVLVLTGIGAFLGHLYPVFFRFQGGKGVATAFGVVTALAWPVGAGLAATWALVALLTRYSSLAALVAAAAAPILALIFTPALAYPLGIGVMSGFLFWRHRDNIKRLLGGTESRIGQKARPAEDATRV